MTGEAALLEAIRAHPADDAPRLVYADWLEERGDPRGEFIQVQCELAASSQDPSGQDPCRRRLLRDRERRLLEDHGRQWRSPARSLGGQQIGFVRGLLEHVEFDAETFLDRAPLLFERAPHVRSLVLRDVSRVVPDLARCRALERISSLTIHEPYEAPGARPPRSWKSLLSPHDLATLAGSRHLRRLESFGLIDVGVSVYELEALLEAANAWPLTALRLAGHRLGDECIGCLVAQPNLTRLASLDLSRNAIGDRGAHELAQAPALRSLVRLCLAQNLISREGARALRRRYGNQVTL